MSQSNKNSYQFDLVLQGIFYFPMIFFYGLAMLYSPSFVVLGMFAQFWLIVIQLISSAYHALQHKSEVHKNYHIWTIFYIVLLFLGANSQYAYPEVFFLIIIPVLFATWYYDLTWELYKKEEASIKRKSKKLFDDMMWDKNVDNRIMKKFEGREDILDDMM